MSSLEEKFWLLRNTGQVTRARDVYEMAQGTQLEKSKIELMKISLLRADEGGQKAAEFMKNLEADRIFLGRKDFNFYYQKSMNSAAQGFFSEALTFLLKAKPSDSISQALWHTSRLTFLDNLGLADKKNISEAKETLLPTLHKSIYEACAAVVERIESRDLFKSGHIQSLIELTHNRDWDQVYYFCAWVSSLPYIIDEADKTSQVGINKLIEHTDFYLRDYRLQTLVGPQHVSQSQIVSTWSDKAERLYLWTWRWLAAPTQENLLALKEIVRAFDEWSKEDFLTSFELGLVRLSLDWLSLYDKRILTRFSALYDHSGQVIYSENSIFQLESKWQKVLATTMRSHSSAEGTALQEIHLHSLSSEPRIRFDLLINKLQSVSSAKKSSSVISVEPSSGYISYFDKSGIEKQIVSQSLSSFFVMVKSHQRVNFEDILQTCFQIPFYDEEVHQIKVHNLLQRARHILHKHGTLKTRLQWVFFKPEDSLEIVTHSLKPLIAPLAKKPGGAKDPTLAKNERSLNAVLKIKQSEVAKDYSRQDLERILHLPKSTINRYIKVWIQRKWLSKKGNGPQVRYRLTLSDS